MNQNQQENNIDIWVKDQLVKGYDQQSIRQRLLDSGYDSPTIDNIMIKQNKSSIGSGNIETEDTQDAITKRTKKKTVWFKGIIVLIIIILLILLFNIFSENNIVNPNEQTNQDVINLYNSFFENEFCHGEINESFDFNHDMCNLRVTYANNLLIDNSKGIYLLNYDSFQEDIQKETGNTYKNIKGDLYNITAISTTQLALFSNYPSFFMHYFIYDTDDMLKDEYFNKRFSDETVSYSEMIDIDEDAYFNRIFSDEALSYSKMIEINKTENSEKVMSFCFTAFNAYLDITRSLIFDDKYPARDNYTNIDYVFFENFIESNINIHNNLTEVYDNNKYDLEPYWTKYKYGQAIKKACMDRIRDINSRLTISSVTFDSEKMNIYIENTGHTNISLKRIDCIINSHLHMLDTSCEIIELLVNEKTVCKIDTTNLKPNINKTSDFKIKMISDYGTVVYFEYEGE